MYGFGDYTLDDRLRRLYRRNDVVALTPKVFDTLLALVERAGRVVEKDEMMRVVWGDTVVGDETLAQNISTLRRLLEITRTDRSFIATVPRCGYRFIAAVTQPLPVAGRQLSGLRADVGDAASLQASAGRRGRYPSMGSNRSARGCRPNQRVGLDTRALGPTGSGCRIHRL